MEPRKLSSNTTEGVCFLTRVTCTSPKIANAQEIFLSIKDKIFLGEYIERRYVESLKAYRDIITIEPNDDIVENLWTNKFMLHILYKNAWIGISKDPQNCKSHNCLLWVTLQNIPIGKHWFKINNINVQNKEIIMDVQHVQPFRLPETKFGNIDLNFPPLKEIFTYSNICEAIKFSSILIMTIITFLVELIKFIKEYSIEIGYLIINLIDVSKPILLAIFEMIGKCIFGLYWLIFVLYKGNPD